jgi:GTPase SAR1 family protein
MNLHAYRGATAVLIVYDVTLRESFNNLIRWELHWFCLTLSSSILQMASGGARVLQSICSYSCCWH